MKTYLNLGLAFRDARGSLRVSLELIPIGERAALATADYCHGVCERFICSPRLALWRKAEFRVIAAECSRDDTVKSLEWSYPSSENAQRFGYADTGCWTIQLGAPGKVAHAVLAFAPAQEAYAKDRAAVLPFAWSSAMLHCHPELATAL